MTRKDFEAMAQLIRETYTDSTETEEALKNLAERMAAMFKRENPRFNRAIFLTACGF